MTGAAHGAWSRQQGGDGVARLDDGARRDDGFPCLPAIEGLAGLEHVQGTARPWAMLPCGPSLWRDALKPVFGIDRMQARPGVRCRDEALRPLGGFKAEQGHNVVQSHWRDLEAWCHGGRRALAQAGVCGKRVTGRMAGPAVETPHRAQGWGQVTGQRRIDDQGGRVPASAVTVDGWTVRLWIDAGPKMPLAVQGGPLQAHAARWPRAVGAPEPGPAGWPCPAAQRRLGAGRLGGPRAVVAGPAWPDLGGAGHHPQGGAGGGPGARGGGRGRDQWRAGPHGAPWAGPRGGARTAGNGGGGSTGLTTYEPEGTEAHGRHPQRRAFAATPSQAVGGRPGQGTDEGPGGHPVFLTHAAGAQPLPPGAADDDRRRIEPGWIKAAKPPWDVPHPPHNTARAVRVHVMCTRLLVARAPAYRRHGERAALGGEPVGWQRWRRQLLEHPRDQGIVLAQGASGSFPLAVVALLLGANLQAVPPELGTRREIFAKSDLPPKG